MEKDFLMHYDSNAIKWSRSVVTPCTLYYDGFPRVNHYMMWINGMVSHMSDKANEECRVCTGRPGRFPRAAVCKICQGKFAFNPYMCEACFYHEMQKQADWHRTHKLNWRTGRPYLTANIPDGSDEDDDKKILPTDRFRQPERHVSFADDA